MSHINHGYALCQIYKQNLQSEAYSRKLQYELTGKPFLYFIKEKQCRNLQKSHDREYSAHVLAGPPYALNYLKHKIVQNGIAEKHSNYSQIKDYKKLVSLYEKGQIDFLSLLSISCGNMSAFSQNRHSLLSCFFPHHPVKLRLGDPETCQQHQKDDFAGKGQHSHSLGLNHGSEERAEHCICQRAYAPACAEVDMYSRLLQLKCQRVKQGLQGCHPRHNEHIYYPQGGGFLLHHKEHEC